MPESARRQVFVFGATGFIGRPVVRELLEHGHAVTALVRDVARAQALGLGGARLVQGDIERPDSFAGVLTGCEVVVKMSNPPLFGRLGTARLRRMQRQLLKHVQNILLEVRRAGSPPIILTEGTGTYGDTRTQTLGGEPSYRLAGYSKTGALYVPFVRSFTRENGLRTITLLPGDVYGPGSWFKEILVDPMRKNKFRYIGRGQNVGSRVHIDDAARAYRLAIAKLPIGESLPVVDDRPTSMREFTEFVAAELGVPAPKSVPRWLAKLALGAVPVEHLTSNFRISNERTKAILQWSPRYPSYKEGVPDVVARLDG